MTNSTLLALEALRASNDPPQLLRSAGINVSGSLIQGPLESLAMSNPSSAGWQNDRQLSTKQFGSPSQEEVHTFIDALVSATKRDSTGLADFFRYVVRGGAAPAVADYLIRDQGCDIAELTEGGRSLGEIAGSQAMLNVLQATQLELAATGKLKPSGTGSSSASEAGAGGDAPKSKGPGLGM